MVEKNNNDGTEQQRKMDMLEKFKQLIAEYIISNPGIISNYYKPKIPALSVLEKLCTNSKNWSPLGENRKNKDKVLYSFELKEHIKLPHAEDVRVFVVCDPVDNSPMAIELELD